MSLVVAACGGGGDDPEVSPDTVPPSTTSSTSPPRTTTTEPGTVPTNPLTGEEATDFAVAGRPAIVVKLGNNGPESQPHVGINQADIVFEEEIESQATRFAAVFHSNLPVEAGPVRSARVTEVDLLANLTRPVLVDSGANATTNGIMAQAQEDGLLVRFTDNRTSHYRVSGRARPDNLFVGFEQLFTLFPDDLNAPTPIFDYEDLTISDSSAGATTTTSDESAPGGIPTGIPLGGIEVATRVPVDWVYDADTDQYIRFSNGVPHTVDDGSAQLSTDTLVIMTIEYGRSPIPGTPQAITIGSGPVLILQDGQALTGTWNRAAQPDPYTLIADDGTPMELSPGRSWVTLARDGQVTLLDDETVATWLDAALVD